MINQALSKKNNNKNEALEAGSELALLLGPPRAAAFARLLVQRDDKREIALAMVMNLTKIKSFYIRQPTMRQ